jgi:outer membrane protein assembly factor BamA
MNHPCFCRFRITLLFFCIGFTWNASFAISSDQTPVLAQGKIFDTIIIHQIIISGNSITKRSIIFRELNFKEHDTLSVVQFSERLINSKQNIFNTRLFNFVTVDTFYTAGTPFLDVRIEVVERWYIWPIPFFEISDRNLNVWFETRDFNRLTYGVDFTFSNLRGRNETLKILTHFGYNQKFGFTYKIPYINEKQTFGTTFGADIELNHELPVFTLNNKPVYKRSNSVYLKKLLYGFTELNFRPDIFSTHTFRLAFSYYNFDSSIHSIPGFVLSLQAVQQFFSFCYQYKNDHRDIQYYPLKGYCVDAEVNHAVPYETAQNSYVRTNLRIYAQIYNKWYWASGFTGKLCFEKKQPYYLQRGLGYGRDYVRGYEYYVVDGQHFILFKNNLKFALLPQRVQKIGFMQSDKFNTIPLALYINIFADMGFVFHYPGNLSDKPDTGNNLENSFLIGYGLGLDFTTYYDIVIRAEGALNRLGQPGFYLHFIAPI